MTIQSFASMKETNTTKKAKSEDNDGDDANISITCALYSEVWQVLRSQSVDAPDESMSLPREDSKKVFDVPMGQH